MIDIRKVKLPMGLGVEPTSIMKNVQLKAGLAVRVIAPALLGIQGVIETIDNSPTKIASGVSTYLVTVVTRQQKLRVPFENLEVLQTL